MSDLILSYEGLPVPPQACFQSPPQPNARGVRPEDDCFITLPLVDDGNISAIPRQVRFDRSGDQFILSPTNSLENREWVESHANLPTFFDTLRLTGAMITGPDFHLDRAGIRVLLVISQYVMTGEIRTRETIGDSGHETVDESELANGLLDIFTDSNERVLGHVLGQLQLARGYTWLSAEGQARIRWISHIRDLVGPYRRLRNLFVAEADISHWDVLPTMRREDFDYLISFLRELVVDHDSHRPFRFRNSFLLAHDAYQSLYQDEIQGRRRPDFCSVLQRGLAQLEGRSSAGRQFIQECQAVLRFRRMSPEEALRRSLRDSLSRPENLQGLREAIAEESREANMSLQWLMHRGSREDGRIGEVWEILLRSIRIQFPAEEDANPNLSLDVSHFIQDCNHLAEGDLLHRREYLLAILAVLRHLFGESGAPPSIRVFVREGYRQVPWNFSERSLEQLRRFLTQVERRRATSQERTDTMLPWLLGSACVAGAAGVTMTELLTDRRDQEGLHLGLGTGSAAIGGGGCLGFVGHYVWPEIFEVRNHWLWDGITSGVGAVVGAGLFYFLHLILPQGPDTRRFPVDEYGP